MTTPRFKIGPEDINDPKRLLRTLNRMVEHEYTLLSQLESLRASLRATSSGMSAEVARVVRSLEIGGPDTVLPAQRAAIPKYDTLPGESAFAEGDAVSVGGSIYILQSGVWVEHGGGLDPHATTHEVGGSDPLVNDLDANARVGVRLNSGVTTHRRRRINFIPGSARIAFAMADDAGGEEVDLTVSLPANNHVSTEDTAVGTSIGDSTEVLLVTNKTGSPLTLGTVGLWVVLGNIVWDANTTGVRQARIVTGGGGEYAKERVDATSDGETGHSLATVIFVGSSLTVDLRVLQTSTGSLNCRWSLDCVLIH